MTASISLNVLNADDAFARQLQRDGQGLDRVALGTLQLNLGKLCNLACHHCHVEAGPRRTELMSRATMDRILDWLDRHGERAGIATVDLTGGAPEMNPNFRWLVEALVARGLHIIDRCNLTILLEPGYEDLAAFLARHQVEIAASLPCYLEDNVDQQRGKGVYHDSIEALERLNAAGYGDDATGLRLDLVYNPVGYGLPGPQAPLERDYKHHLATHFGIRFNRLWTITNMPIKRFEHALRRDGKFDAYMARLVAAHNPANVEHVMCRSLVSVGWQGAVYDCDFNQMLQLPLDGGDTPQGADEHVVEASARKLWDFTPDELVGRTIRTGDHCFGCTAGHGSSCTGALA
ncbi:MAG: radical SAM/Cys-rich domain protein [Rhodospirillales bacterium]|nr:radical SAM/Cys-rich domain protein [Rhodospirillales bacterium]